VPEASRVPIRQGEQGHGLLPDEEGDGSDTLRREGRRVGLQRVAVLLELAGKRI